MALRELLLKLDIDVDKKGESSALSAVQGLAKYAKVAAGAFAALGIGKVLNDAVQEVAQLSDELDSMSKVTGIGIEALQELRFAGAQLGNVEAGAMSDALTKLQRNAVEASQGSKTLAADFAKLGVSVTDSSGNVKSAEQLFMEVADGMANVSNDSEKVALSMSVLGKSGKRLIPVMQGGSKAIQEQRDLARSLGGVIGEDLAKKSAEYADAQERMKFATLGLKTAIAEELVPVLLPLVESFTKLIAKMRGPLQRVFQSLKRVFKGLSEVTTLVTDKLGLLGTALLSIGAALAVLQVSFLVVGQAATIAALKSAAAWIIATAPLLLTIALFGIIAAAIYLVIDDFVAMGEGAESVTGTIVQGFLDLKNELGSWGAAIVEIFKTAFVYWLPEASATFFEFVNFLTEFITMAKDVWVGIFLTIAETVVGVFTTAKDFVVDTFDSLMAYVQGIVDKILAFVEPVRSAIGGALSFFGVGEGGQPPNPAGVTGAGAAPSPVAGGPSMVNQPSTSVQVQVDAAGAADAQEVGAEVARQVDAALQRRDRQTSQAFREAIGAT